MTNQKRAENLNYRIAHAIGAVRANGSFPTLSFTDTILAALDENAEAAEARLAVLEGALRDTVAELEDTVELLAADGFLTAVKMKAIKRAQLALSGKDEA